jgi:glutathione synthase/RimK-type ligase-like ATP-grasp enzyme
MDRDLRVLVTCGRFAPATALVRQLHDAGASVDVADACKLAPALHSNAADEIHVVAPPAREPVRFAQDVAKIMRQRRIDLVVPAFEEGFYLARYAELVPAPLFAPPFETIARLHDKSRFLKLCRDLGLRMPRTTVVDSRDDLREAVRDFDEFVARPAFSRGGQIYLTNHGPRAGETAVDDCDPTPDNPWLVQEYVDGEDACSFSVAREGQVVVHCPYAPSIPSPGGWSVQFSSIEDFGSLEVASRICAELGVNGFIGFDYRRTRDGLVMIECNPRCSAGIFLCPEGWVGEAVIGDQRTLRMVEPGRRRQYDAYLLDRHMTRLPAPRLVHELLTTPDAFMSTAGRGGRRARVRPPL